MPRVPEASSTQGGLQSLAELVAGVDGIEIVRGAIKIFVAPIPPPGIVPVNGSLVPVARMKRGNEFQSPRIEGPFQFTDQVNTWPHIHSIEFR